MANGNGVATSLRTWPAVILALFGIAGGVWAFATKLAQPDITSTARQEATLLYQQNHAAIEAETKDRRIEDERLEQRLSKQLDEQREALIRIEQSQRQVYELLVQHMAKTK